MAAAAGEDFFELGGELVDGLRIGVGEVAGFGGIFLHVVKLDAAVEGLAFRNTATAGTRAKDQFPASVADGESAVDAVVNDRGAGVGEGLAPKQGKDGVTVFGRVIR